MRVSVQLFPNVVDFWLDAMNLLELVLSGLMTQAPYPLCGASQRLV